MHHTPTIEEYSDEEEHPTQPPLTRQSSSGSSEEDSEHDDEQSSSTGSSQPSRETPTTSPASLWVFVHGHGGHAEEEAEESEEESEEESDEGENEHDERHVPAPDLTRTTAAGYELLANKLSESPKKGNGLIRKGGGNLVPMYRKFEHLNHRVLLHLQDEVCEMEEELRYLDESIAQMSPRDDAGHAFPASRRNDARYGGELHYKRTELLGRIFQKLGQYNQALTSFNGLVKELDPAGADDIQAYRTWMEKRAPIDSTETRFLERKHDLLAVSRPAGASTTRGGQQQPAVIWLPAMLVVPLLAFVIVPSVVGRLVVIALISGAGFRQVTLTAELVAYMTVQEWSIAASM
ncbi:hypothetical protein BDU57DRAFT_574289 [Ampelomyces quisqualis]|uniref:DUF6594 domain-containing protein n=1 Tax=Ampelomyces quisqualis TaxID=50730 RepID=A0A6A5QLZ8_AMPQU|nr:hypothetical protein BDU57DRAFT_574289 [Ampelomyces quisqualis]